MSRVGEITRKTNETDLHVRVNLDGTAFALLDDGNATHTSTLSPSFAAAARSRVTASVVASRTPPALDPGRGAGASGSPCGGIVTPHAAPTPRPGEPAARLKSLLLARAA